jgi:hypothetical protein
MLPIALVSLGGLFFVLANLLYGLVTIQFGYVIAGMFGALPTSVGLYISGKFLYRVTRRHPTEDGAGGGSATDAGQLDTLDTDCLKCLECGATIPSDAAQCVSCGWSYADD